MTIYQSDQKSYKTYFSSVGPFLEGYIESTCFILGGSPYPRMDGRKIAKLLEEGYRMPKPQHVNEKLYEKKNCLFLFPYVAFSPAAVVIVL